MYIPKESVGILKDIFKHLMDNKKISEEKKVEISELARKCYLMTQDYLGSIKTKEEKDITIYSEILNNWVKLSANIRLINSELGDNIMLIINRFRDVHDSKFYDKDRFSNELDEIFSKLENVIKIKSEEDFKKERRQFLKWIALVSGSALLLPGDIPERPTMVIED